MARLLRTEFPGPLHHISSRGDRREALFEQDEDRAGFPQTLAKAMGRFKGLCHAFRLKRKHSHLAAETAEGLQSKGMRNVR